MDARPIIGWIVIAFLLIGVVYAIVSPIAPIPEIPEVERGRVVREYSLDASQVSGIEYVDLKLALKIGGIDVNFTDDGDLVYGLRFRQNEGAAEPIIEYVRSNNRLLVSVTSEEGDLKASFGNRYLYNGTLKVGLGGINVVLSKNSNVESFDFDIMYAGGLSLEILGGASFDRLNFKATAGGLKLRIAAPSLRRAGSLSGRVELGGLMVEPVSVGSNIGVRIAALTDIGGVEVNPAGFELIKQTDEETEIRTSNYPTAETKLDIDFSVGLGGVLINTQLFPVPYATRS